MLQAYLDDASMEPVHDGASNGGGTEPAGRYGEARWDALPRSCWCWMHTPPETPFLHSGASPEDNLATWADIQRGADYGREFVVRARLNLSCTSASTRDPVMFRCIPRNASEGCASHLVPSSDFADAIIDSLQVQCGLLWRLPCLP